MVCGIFWDRKWIGALSAKNPGVILKCYLQNILSSSWVTLPMHRVKVKGHLTQTYKKNSQSLFNRLWHEFVFSGLSFYK